MKNDISATISYRLYFSNLIRNFCSVAKMSVLQKLLRNEMNITKLIIFLIYYQTFATLQNRLFAEFS